MNDSALINVYGHEWAQKLLRQAVVEARAAHAYLLVGPDRIGKTTLALALAQALTCVHPQDAAGVGGCGQCRSCQLAAQGSHPDHHLVEPDGQQIKIEQVRGVIREAVLSPIESAFKVFILRAFDRANINAANALLKTLEEPAPTTRIILTSSQMTGLLPTIISRCQVLSLRPLSAQGVTDALVQGWSISPVQAALWGGLSGGRMGWAIEMATGAEAWAVHQSWLQMLHQLVAEPVTGRLAMADQLVKEDRLEEILQAWLWWWRDVILIQQGCPHLILNRNHVADLTRYAQGFQGADIKRFLQAMLTTAGYLRQNVNSLLALESLLLKAPTLT